MKRSIFDGKEIWTVYEHFYYEPDGAAPRKEYCVALVELNAYMQESPRHKCLKYSYMDADGCLRLGYFLGSEIGGPNGQLYFTAEEAALEAKRVSDRYDRAFAFCGDTPIRRTWERLLPKETAKCPEIEAFKIGENNANSEPAGKHDC